MASAISQDTCNIDALAGALFDLRATHEAELRTLTWIQRSLEALRSGRPCGDAELLLREMARLFEESVVTATTVAYQRKCALDLIAGVIADRTTASTVVPVVAAVPAVVAAA
jgi:hypothetical protein